MKQVSSVKSSKLNGFLLALLFIQGLGQNLALENLAKIGTFSRNFNYLLKSREQKLFSENLCHNVLALFNKFASV